MTFETNKIITGIVKKTSKKTGNEYRMITYLNDNGTTFTSLVDDELEIPADIKQLTECKVKFEVSFYNGSVSGLKTIGIAKKVA